MLTRLTVANFKRLAEADIPLGQNVVFVGPNNSGKTSALQALALWRSGLDEWTSRRGEASKADSRTGVTLNRRALTHTPVGDTRHLFRDLVINKSRPPGADGKNGKVYLTITVEGEGSEGPWSVPFEFYHANAESIYCKPRSAGKSGRIVIPESARNTRIVLLPPMSGLASEEPEIQTGRIAVLIGEGQTAQVIRNLCLQVHRSDPAAWDQIVSAMDRMFGVRFGAPNRDPGRGTIELDYAQHGVTLDLPNAGRGMQQVLLLLAHMHVNRGQVLLLDEPDAHLEILRQKQVYLMVTDFARATGSQVIAASHSEVILTLAAANDVVVAFVGKPHRIDDRGSQLAKALKDIPFDHYYQAEQKGFVLYLEGATDLAILRAFARIIRHSAFEVLDTVFAHYVGNQPTLAQHHFHGLQEAKSDLTGFAVFDRLQQGLPPSLAFKAVQWKRREIENYLCQRSVLLRFAEGLAADDLIERVQKAERVEAMTTAIEDVEKSFRGLDEDPWSDDFKVSDKFLPLVFKRYYARIAGDNRLDKTDFHLLVDYLKPEEVHADIVAVLDAIVKHANEAIVAN